MEYCPRTLIGLMRGQMGKPRRVMKSECTKSEQKSDCSRYRAGPSVRALRGCVLAKQEGYLGAVSPVHWCFLGNGAVFRH